MVSVEELLFRQGQLETEVLCLQDALNRLTQRIFILESFIKHKHGDLALDETVLLSPGPGPENEDNSFVGDFSDLFVANPDVGVDGTQTHEIIITTKPQQSSNNSSQSVPDLSVEDVESRSDTEEQEEQENVPDAVREETVSVSGASVNVMDVSVYDGESISGQINLMGNDVEEYTEVVTYGVIPTSMVYDHQQPSSDLLEDNSPLLPPNKHAGTIRIYKPELKSFTRIPNGVEPSEDSTEDDPKHQCSVCHKFFIQKENMHRHMLLHSVVRFRCDECDRDFNNVHNLNLHKGKHQRQKERKEKADVEKQSALTRKTDNSNSSFKSGDFKCTYCGLSFATKSRKTGHERTHTTMKPFACDICGLSFRSKSGLADHTIGHSGQRSHLCHICPAGFLRSRNLLKHIRFVHSLVQIKTVLDGKRIVEFVSPEQADILIEQRKHNVESQESKAERATSCKTSNFNSNNYSKTEPTLTEPQSRQRLQRSSASKSSKTNTSTIARSKRCKKISDNAISKINSSSRKVEYLKRKSRVLSGKQDKDAIKANSININRDSKHIQVNSNSSEDELTDEEALLLSKNPSDIMVNMDEGENELIDQDILDHIKSEPEDYEDEDDL